jgi:hypothetical protein
VAWEVTQLQRLSIIGQPRYISLFNTPIDLPSSLRQSFQARRSKWPRCRVPSRRAPLGWTVLGSGFRCLPRPAGRGKDRSSRRRALPFWISVSDALASQNHLQPGHTTMNGFVPHMLAMLSLSSSCTLSKAGPVIVHRSRHPHPHRPGLHSGPLPYQAQQTHRRPKPQQF